MIYEIENIPKKLSYDLLDDAVHFAASFLGLDGTMVIQFETLPKHQCGFCDYEDQDDIIVILARRLSRRELILTLFHELVHVKQYVEGRLCDDTIWDGIDYSGVDYVELPWEQEAHELEQVMIEQFESKIKL